MSGNRSISIGGSVTGSAVVAGDGNTVTVNYQQAEIPPAETVDVAAELAALKEALAGLQAEDKDRKKIDNALEEAEDESGADAPDRDEVGAALERALKYAQKADGFARQIDKLKPHVQNLAGWLGENWYKLLSVVGLTT